MNTNVPRPPEPYDGEFHMWDVVEHDGVRGLIVDLNFDHTCSIMLEPFAVNVDIRVDTRWALDKCVRIGKLWEMPEYVDSAK